MLQPIKPHSQKKGLKISKPLPQHFMQDSIPEEAKAAERADYMEWVGQITGPAHLNRQPGKMINFISKKNSDHINLSQ